MKTRTVLSLFRQTPGRLLHSRSATLSVLIGLCVWTAGAQGLNTRQILDALQSSNAPAGFCVHLGCGGGSLTAELAKNERLAVHALEPDLKKVERARSLLLSKNLYGQAVVEHWTEKFLPFADNLVNVLVAEDSMGISETELLRVLAPLGTLWVKTEGRWKSTKKPWPAELDEWTHWRHGADGNMVSRDQAVETPSGLRWIAGPPQDDGGRKWYYDHVLVSAAGRNFYQYEDELVARDGFNGRLLWRRPAKAYIFKEVGAVQPPWKLGNRTSKVRPVAHKDRLYVPIEDKLLALDAASGQTVLTFYCELKSPRELIVANDLLVVSDTNAIRALCLDGNLRWGLAEPARRMVAGGNRFYFLNESALVCLDLATGKELWRTEHPYAYDAQTFAYYNGVIVLERSVWRDSPAGSGIGVFSGESGKLMWTKRYKPGMTHFKEPRTVFAGGLIWIEAMSTNKVERVKWIGLDPQNGAEQKSLGSRGLHCAAPLATDRFLITPEMEFTDLETGKQNRARMAKSACRQPFVAANGLLYSFTVQCECFPMLRGYMGLAQTPLAQETAMPRLQTGPAFGRQRSKVTPAPEDWPMYRHDNVRSGSTPTSLPEGALDKKWEAQLAQSPQTQVAADWQDDPFVPGLITAPVCVSNLVLVAVPNQHRVVALDAATGVERWSYVAGGRVDLPPTVYEGLCLFGAHDGYVYCLEFSTGQLVWRFRAAPQETRIAVYGQMESPWPVAGSVYVQDGLACFVAGRHPLSDGGLRAYAVEAADGKLVWEKSITDPGVRNWYSAILPGTRVKVGVDYEPVDLFVRDGDKISMSRWRLDPAEGTVTLAFTNVNYEPYPGLKIPRGLWGYGIRQTKMVLEKVPAAFTEEKLYRATTNDTALLLAANLQIIGTRKGELKVNNETVFQLDSAPVHDGLIAARGRIYAATRGGKLYCLGNSE